MHAWDAPAALLSPLCTQRVSGVVAYGLDGSGYRAEAGGTNIYFRDSIATDDQSLFMSMHMIPSEEDHDKNTEIRRSFVRLVVKTAAIRKGEYSA